MAFIDEVKVYVKGGKGGNGCVSFRREKFVAFGGPDGGKGGKGSNIIFRASRKFNTLLKFHYQPHITGYNGEHGSSSNRTGASGEDIIIEVPLGTQVYSSTNELIADLVDVSQELLVAEGGRGGYGNNGSRDYSKTQHHNPGEEGEEKTLFLKLKILADVGIIGLPNAGKSTFLSLCSNAKPKIADYQFTTLSPEIGIVELDDNRDFIMADIPGLIEGAHTGLGLGHRFLKHIERCGVILHLIDCMQENIITTYEIIRAELNQYNKDLVEKKELIAISKCDLLPAEIISNKVVQLENYLQQKVHTISITETPKDLLNMLYKQLDRETEQVANKEAYSPI